MYSHSYHKHLKQADERLDWNETAASFEIAVIVPSL